MTYRISVLDRHVAEALEIMADDGAGNICMVCPVALAISEVFGRAMHVNMSQAHYSPEEGVEYCWDLPEEVGKKIANFDRTREMDPFEFELEDFPLVWVEEDEDGL